MNRSTLKLRIGGALMALGLMFSCVSCGNVQNDGGTKTFTGLSFNDQAIAYDGNAHTIYVENVPTFASVTYMQPGPYTDVGTYNIGAKVSAPEYIDCLLYATLKIEKAPFTGLAFNSVTVDYDGDFHSIGVTGVPAGATVSYKSDHNGITNMAKDPGVYNITATIQGSNYITKTMNATLTINKVSLPNNLTFPSYSGTYDGNAHTVTVQGAPSDANIVYSSDVAGVKNTATDAGTYNVTAVVGGTKYVNQTLTTTINIAKADIKNATFADKTVKYNGQNQSISVGNIPAGVTVTYSSDVTGVTNSAKNVGVYNVTAKLTGKNYNDLTLTAKLTIEYDPDYKESFTGITFANSSIVADGNSHTIVATGYPDGTTVTYKDAGPYTNVGTYTITATFEKEGYTTLTLTATLTITAKPVVTNEKEGTYVKVSETTTDWSGYYLLTFNDKYALDGSLGSDIDKISNYVSIKPVDDEIDVDSTLAKSAVKITKTSSGYTVQLDNGSYIYCASASRNKLSTSTTKVYCDISYSDGNLLIQSNNKTLRFNTDDTQMRFRFVSSDLIDPIEAYRLEDTTPKPLEALTFSSSSYDVQVGKTKTLTPIKTPTRSESTYTWSSANTNVATVSNGVVTAKAIGSTTITVTSVEYPTINASTTINVVDKIVVDKTALSYDYNDYYDNYAYTGSTICSEGTSKLLVIPIWFTDSQNQLNKLGSNYPTDKTKIRSDIQTAYFGSEAQTGWHSVKSFYETESFGAVSLSGTVAPWYECGKTTAYLGGDDNYATRTNELINDAVDNYFSTNPSDSRTNYDLDKDGYLDGVCCIYAAPDYYTGNLDENSYGNLWAYCYWCEDENSTPSTSKPIASVYFWASYDFMYEDLSHCTIDAHTFIHECGHMFGLDDYYDYNSYYENEGDDYYSPAGDSTMQDNNVGGHDPFSVMALGWAKPYVPTTDCTIEIGDFQSTHDLILLSPDGTNSPFDEYILLELYTPTGLNELDATYAYGKRSILPTNIGVRAWHVDARLAQTVSYNNDEFSYSNTLTTVPTTISGKDGYDYGTMLACSNTHYIKNSTDENNNAYSSCLGSPYYNYKLLKLLRAGDTSTSYSKVFGCMDNSDLFKAGQTFTMSKYKNQFYNSGKLDSGKDLGWSFTVDSITGTGSNAKATITISAI